MLPSKKIISSFPFVPTSDQLQVCQLWDFFLKKDDSEQKKVFVLKGYAGTGKTTLISQLVKHELGYGYVLLAPTGRAAKVMSSYSGKKASTIHKEIYALDNTSGSPVFKKRKNSHGKSIYIVDEASMLSDDSDGNSYGLLTDLVRYVFEKKDNKLIFVGDPAQLPPVKKELSPALDTAYLKFNFDLEVAGYELTEVVRQEKKSGILYNATNLREAVFSENLGFKFFISGFRDLYRMHARKLEDGLRYAYNKYGMENTAIVCRSNKSAVEFNKYIRHQILFRESEIEAGDLIMVVKNNYATLPDDHAAGFIANGDFAEVRKIKKEIELHGFRFAILELQLCDYPDEPSFESHVILDVLHSNVPNLSGEDYNKLYESVLEDYKDLPKYKRMVELKKDSFLNALQIKFAYALTCHKSQGGQWNAVFVDQGYMTEEMLNKEYLRWLYTAITRASDELYLFNFDDRFFENGKIIE